MSDTPSKDKDPLLKKVEKYLPILRQRDDAFVKLRIGQGLISIYNEVVYNKSPNEKFKKVHDLFQKGDYEKLTKAIKLLQEATEAGRSTPSISIDLLETLLQLAEIEIEGLSSTLRRKYIESYGSTLDNRRQYRDDKELIKELIERRFHEERALQDKEKKEKEKTRRDEEAKNVPPELQKWEKPSIKEETKPSWEKPTVKQWPKWEKEDQPGIKRLPPAEEIEDIKESIARVTPILTDIMEASGGSHERVGGDRVDLLIDLLDKGLSFDQFFKAAWSHMPNLFKANEEHLQSKLERKRKEKEKEDSPRLNSDILKLENQLSGIKKLKEDLKSLHDNWTKHFMEKKAGEKSYKCKTCNYKNLKDHDEAMVHEDLGHTVETKETPWATPAEIIPEIKPKLPGVPKEAEEHAGRKFVQKATPSTGTPPRELLCDGCGLPITKNDVSYVIDNRMYHGRCRPADTKPPTLWEKIKGFFKLAAPIESLIKKDQKGPSAEEEKYIVAEIVNHLNSSGVRGAGEEENEEANVTKASYDYLKSKAAHYEEDNLQRIARKAYASWKSSQPIPSDVGSEGKSGVGVAPMGGTGVYVEPSRGNADVQNPSPTNTVRKEAARDDSVKVGDKFTFPGPLKEGKPVMEFVVEVLKISGDNVDINVSQVSGENPEDREVPLDVLKNLIQRGELKALAITARLKISASDEGYVCWNCDTGYHERCREASCTCCHGNSSKKEAAKTIHKEPSEKELAEQQTREKHVLEQIKNKACPECGDVMGGCICDTPWDMEKEAAAKEWWCLTCGKSIETKDREPGGEHEKHNTQLVEIRKIAGGQGVSELVKNPIWQKLRESFVGTWKETPGENVSKLKHFLGENPSEDKLRIVLNYLTGSGFRSGNIRHEGANRLLKWVKKQLESKRPHKEAGLDGSDEELQNTFMTSKDPHEKLRIAREMMLRRNAPEAEINAILTAMKTEWGLLETKDIGGPPAKGTIPPPAGYFINEKFPHVPISVNKEAELGIIARIIKRKDGYHVLAETGRHMGGPYKSREQAHKRLQQIEMFKHMKGELNMNFEVGESAILNKRVGKLTEGTEVIVTAVNEGEVTFVVENVLGITKVAHLDKVTTEIGTPTPLTNPTATKCYHCGAPLETGAGRQAGLNYYCTKCYDGREEGLLKIAASELEKYPWNNDGLKFKLELGDRVKIGAIEYEGINLKGREGTIREKVIGAHSGKAEKYYLVECDGCGHNCTLPEEVLSKMGKEEMQTWRAIGKEDKEELKKEAVLFPNVKFVEEFLKSYKHPPTVVTTDDIEAFAADEKRSYVITKKDMKDVIRQLQNARVEVRVPVAKEAPEEIVKELGGAEAPSEIPEGVKKTAFKYKYTSPDGKTIVEKEVTEDQGPSIEVEDPKNPTGPKIKYTKAALEVCSTCHGEHQVECSCMDDANIWGECAKCNETGWVNCPSCK